MREDLSRPQELVDLWAAASGPGSIVLALRTRDGQLLARSQAAVQAGLGRVERFYAPLLAADSKPLRSGALRGVHFPVRERRDVGDLSLLHLQADTTYPCYIRLIGQSEITVRSVSGEVHRVVNCGDLPRPWQVLLAVALVAQRSKPIARLAVATQLWPTSEQALQSKRLKDTIPRLSREYRQLRGLPVEPLLHTDQRRLELNADEVGGDFLGLLDTSWRAQEFSEAGRKDAAAQLSWAALSHYLPPATTGLRTQELATVPGIEIGQRAIAGASVKLLVYAARAYAYLGLDRVVSLAERVAQVTEATPQATQHVLRVLAQIGAVEEATDLYWEMYRPRAGRAALPIAEVLRT